MLLQKQNNIKKRQVEENTANAVIIRPYIYYMQSSAISAGSSMGKKEILSSIIKNYWKAIIAEQKKKFVLPQLKAINKKYSE